MFGNKVLFLIFGVLILGGILTSGGYAGQDVKNGKWPVPYDVKKDDSAGQLVLSTPFYTIKHDLKKGGALTHINYIYGSSKNIILKPLETSVRIENYDYSDLYDPKPVITERKDGKSEIVTVLSGLYDSGGRDSGVKVSTKYEYRWGYIKIHKEFIFPEKGLTAKRITVISGVLDSTLSDYGYRQNVAEQENASAFSFGTTQWKKARPGEFFDPPLLTRFVPRYLVFANKWKEGLEWFVSDDLSQWDFKIAGKPGCGSCQVESCLEPLGISFRVDPLNVSAGKTLSGKYEFDFYIGMPIIEGHANKLWLHRGFNRNKGNWISEDEIKKWADSGIRTVHCHNDGDYYNDDLFWHDGVYPPYPPEDMKKYDNVIDLCHKYGIRMATYFSNKELHPVTEEYKKHGEEWGRKPDDRGELMHNAYSQEDEFGAQMCLKSGWLDFLEMSISRVLKNHKLDGVYYDWNVGLFCNNPLHMGKSSNGVSSSSGIGALALSETGHWDIDELISLMEWTRETVGPDGLIIVHDTMTPMFATENFADYVVGMEWGYGLLSKSFPDPEDLPLEWNYSGSRSRGVIGYGTIKKGSPESIYKKMAVETLMTGVAPWPVSDEALELYKIFRPLGDITQYKYEDWRNEAVEINTPGFMSSVYSGESESYVLVANTNDKPCNALLRIDTHKLPYPMEKASSFKMIDAGSESTLDKIKISGSGCSIMVPAESIILIKIKR